MEIPPPLADRQTRRARLYRRARAWSSFLALMGVRSSFRIVRG